MSKTRVAGVLLLAAGCGGGGLGRPVAQFPSKSEIDDVMMSKGESLSAPLKTVDLPSFRIETRAPLPDAAYPAETGWDRYLAARLGGGKAKLSAPLRCAATETARFYLAAGGFPDDGTRRYLAERCGTTLPSFGFNTLSGDVPDSVTDDVLVGKYKASLDDLVAGSHLDAGAAVGLGVARGKGHVAIVLFTSKGAAELSAFNPVVPGERVTLTGKVSADAAYALALVNVGASGVATCEPDRRVELPRFSVTCPFAAADAQTRIEIATRKPGRVMMEGELSVLVRHADDAGLVYEPALRGADAPAADAAAFRAALLSQLNDARSAAKAPPLVLEPRQSQDNERLAPHLYVASTKGNSGLEDRIGLGALAGWDVGGVIRDGGIHWGSVTSSPSATRYMSYALESPFSRYILLDPGMTRVAIGSTVLPPSGAIALITTYAFFQSADHTADENQVFAELVKRRQAKGHAPPKRVAREQNLATALARVAANAMTVDDAMNDAMERVVATEHRGVHGWVVETSDLKQIPWGDALLARDPLEVEVGVTHYKAPGAAWGQYAVIFLIREPASDLRSASARARPVL